MKSSLNIVYLEDSPFAASAVKQALHKGNITAEIRVTGTREEFISAVTGFLPDVILAEYSLPGINCCQALDFLKQSGLSIPFIIISDSISDEMAQELVVIGVDDYIIKSQAGRLPFAVLKSLEKYQFKNQQQKLLQLLTDSEERFRALVENSSDAVVILDNQARPVYASPAVTNVLGYTPEEVIGMDIVSKAHPEDVPAILKAMERVFANPGVTMPGHTSRMLHKDGNWRWIEATITNLLHEPAINGIVDNFRDITDKKASEEKIHHLNRLYAFLSQVNHTLVHALDIQTVFKQVCKIAIETGKFRGAWVGIYSDSSGTVTVAEQKGIAEPYMTGFVTAAQEQEELAAALQLQPYYVTNDIQQDFLSENWKALAAAAGYQSCMVLPLKRSGKIIGSLHLYASETNIFTKAETTLLQEAATGISFSLEFFERERLKLVADEQLKHKERRLSQAQAIAHLGSWETDLVTNSSIWSEEACRIYGLPENDNEQSTQAWLSFVHPQDLQYVVKANQRVLDSMQPFNYQHRIIRKDGQIRYLHVQTHIELDTWGQPISLYGVLQDVTQNEMSSQALRLSESNLNAIMNNTDALIYSLDRNYRYITCNQAHKRVMKEKYGIDVQPGYDIRDSIGKFDPGSIPEWEHINARAFGGEVLKFEKQLNVHGIPCHFKFSIHPIKENNKVTGLSCFVNDITRERQAEEKVLKALEEKNVILESIGDAFFAVDNNWIVSYWNKKAEIVLKCPKETILGRSVWDVFPDAVDTLFYESYHKAVEQNTIQHFEAYYERDNIWFEVSAYPSASGLSIYFRDITSRKNSEVELKELNENLRTYTNELIESKKGLEQFSYIVSHNLRAPVANIIGLAELLGQNIYPPEVKEEFLTGIIVNVKRLDNVILDLNTILQVKRDVSEKRESVDLCEMIDDIKLDLETTLKKEQVKIVTDFEAASQLFIIKSYLHSIFYNLIANSVKYRQPEVAPVIHIKSSQADDIVIISVLDNGLGIDLDKKGKQLFGLYKRFHQHVEGKGMGLFMVKTQVEMLGGKIYVNSAVDKGTEFRMEFRSN
ncbi:PAS domain S-box protein [Dyadobacter chenwenxiniae]|uniref:histidine kinase n=1 Tax=Dyadobacter chenwenxiniae TaxID=2906456 RepID=A0A9X1PJU6_9BACT|nr:PAS domain S-box protein [Dyadobacter chenwenxiniae]MCF0062657.1 PAS domain S-box protein [Dyadobacter chenwenxiniae]UON83600.1 PAS domain S-box protein [Dyadobacter chenwenxiniae]